VNFLEAGETPITLADAAKLFPKTDKGKHPHIKTLERWAINGVRQLGGGNALIKLERLNLSGRYYTSKQAVERFNALRNALPVSHRAIGEQADNALQELIRRGFYKPDKTKSPQGD
jgi:hypothetical protein